jgi:crotonobetainyl-CoA:carnitine CoA-transferase CaiB-like acyl-CoA transferase
MPPAAYAAHRSTEITAYAAGGMMSLMGDPAREPLLAAGHQASYQAGLHAFGATLAGLYSVGTIDVGQRVDIAAMEVMAATLELSLADYLHRGTDVLSHRRGNMIAATLGIYPCADGYLGVHIMARNFPAFARVMGAAWMAEDERFREQRARLIHNDELSAHIFGWAAGVTREEAYRRAAEERCPMAPVLSIPEVLDHPHLRAREAFAEVDDPRAGRLTTPAHPFRTPAGAFVNTPAPRLGEHNTQVYGGLLGLSKRDIVRLRAAGVV